MYCTHSRGSTNLGIQRHGSDWRRSVTYRNFSLMHQNLVCTSLLLQPQDSCSACTYSYRNVRPTPDNLVLIIKYFTGWFKCMTHGASSTAFYSYKNLPIISTHRSANILLFHSTDSTIGTVEPPSRFYAMNPHRFCRSTAAVRCSLSAWKRGILRGKTTERTLSICSMHPSLMVFWEAR
jgi:hypothetical protein